MYENLNHKNDILLSRYWIDTAGTCKPSLASLVALGSALISIGNIHEHIALLYLNFFIMGLAKSVLATTTSVAVANYFEKV